MCRPTKYKEEYCNQAYDLTLLGMIDTELADHFDIAVTTLNEWKKKYPQFKESLKEGKAIADAKVARSLFKRACGYEYKEVVTFEGEVIKTTIKEVSPDTGAAMAWLKNRQKDKWRDSKDLNVTGNVKLEDFFKEK